MSLAPISPPDAQLLVFTIYKDHAVRLYPTHQNSKSSFEATRLSEQTYAGAMFLTSEIKKKLCDGGWVHNPVHQMLLTPETHCRDHFILSKNGTRTHVIRMVVKKDLDDGTGIVTVDFEGNFTSPEPTKIPNWLYKATVKRVKDKNIPLNNNRRNPLYWETICLSVEQKQELESLRSDIVSDLMTNRKWVLQTSHMHLNQTSFHKIGPYPEVSPYLQIFFSEIEEFEERKIQLHLIFCGTFEEE